MKMEAAYGPLMNAAVQAMETPLKAGLQVQQDLLNGLLRHSPVLEEQAGELNRKAKEELDHRMQVTRELLDTWLTEVKASVAEGEKVTNQVTTLYQASTVDAFGRELETLQGLMLDTARHRMETAFGWSNRVLELLKAPPPAAPKAAAPTRKSRKTTKQA